MAVGRLGFGVWGTNWISVSLNRGEEKSECGLRHGSVERVIKRLEFKLHCRKRVCVRIIQQRHRILDHLRLNREADLL